MVTSEAAPLSGAGATRRPARPWMPPLARRLLGERLFAWARAILRVRRSFALSHGRPPALVWPRRYTDKIQWRKLFDLNPLYAVLSDKLAARDFIAARIGPGRTAPLLWHGADPDDIPFARLAPPYVVKSSHACGHVIIVTGPPDEAAIRGQARAWLAQDYGGERNEPGYVPVPRRILVERMLTAPGGARPLEHRVFVFGGRAHVIQTTLIDEHGHPRNAGFHSRTWQKRGWRLITPLDERDIPPPARLVEMLAWAERIGAGLSHVRVDFYACGVDLRVGEVTVYSWSGLAPFHPADADVELGRQWRIRWPALSALWAVACRYPAVSPARSPARDSSPSK